LTQAQIGSTVGDTQLVWRCPDNSTYRDTKKVRLPAGALRSAVQILENSAWKHGVIELPVTTDLIHELVALLNKYPAEETYDAVNALEVALDLPIE